MRVEKLPDYLVRTASSLSIVHVLWHRPGPFFVHSGYITTAQPTSPHPTATSHTLSPAMDYSRYYASSYDYDAEQDYEDLLYQHEWIQREEADFEDFLERRDEQAKKDEQDFEDYLERWNEQAKKDEQGFERYMEQSAIRARELEQTDRLGEKEEVNNPSRTDTSAPATAVAAPRTPLANPVRLTAKCTIYHHAPANTVCTPCSHTAAIAVYPAS